MRFRFLLPALALATAPGCDSILDTEPVDRIPVENAITDVNTARAALIGSYDALTSLSYYGRNFLVLGDLSADNARHRGTLTALGAVDRHQVTVDNGTIEGVWGAIYTAIGRTNLIIQKVPTVVSITDTTVRNQIVGEAHFLRALHYHNLVKLWGDVPMPLVPLTSPDQAAAFQRIPAAQVYAQILTDLDAAARLITNTTQKVQASRGAVDALRSRVLLYMENWQGTIDAATAVYARNYTLVSDYTTLFNAAGTPTSEDIFRLAFSATDYNELGYYYLATGRSEVAPTADLFNAYERNAANTVDDKRFAWSVARRGTTDFEGKKFPTTVGAEDLHVIRLAEVILSKAEAHAMLDQLPQALTEYNKIRVRAGLAPHVLGVNVTTRADVLAAIWKERRLELAFEGDRWPDLVRTKRVGTVLGLAPDRLFQALYPIPQSERVVAPGLSQNPGYPTGT